MSFYCSFWNVPALWLNQFLIDSRDFGVGSLFSVGLFSLWHPWWVDSNGRHETLLHACFLLIVWIFFSLSESLWQTIFFPPNTIDKEQHIHCLD
jgi:hypothetical protein